MSMFREIKLAASLTLAMVTVVQAHPGHGKSTGTDSGTTATHYVTEPVHILSLVAVAGALSLPIVYFARRKRIAEQA